MKVGEITNVLERFAAPQLQEDYDNAGLITGIKDWDCTGVLCTLDITVAVVEEAVQKKCNLIVAHHPIIFKGLKKLTGQTYVEQVILAAIKNNIALYAAHTNLDNVLTGVNHQIAERLKLQHTKILASKQNMLRRLVTFAPIAAAQAVRDALFSAGAGQVGNYSECSFNSNGMGTFKAGEGTHPYVGAIGEQHQEEETKIEVIYPFYLERPILKALFEHHPYEEVAYDIYALENLHQEIGAGLIGELAQPMEETEFLSFVKQQFGLSVIKYTSLRQQPIKRVAVCGGAGSFLIRQARQQGADIYITSDIKYHEFFDAEGQIVVADIGHYESEQFTILLLHDLLREKFPTFAVLKTSVNTNPVQYFL